MGKTSQKKYLVALDGSDYALNVIRYLSEFEAFHKMKLVLFHVFSKAPEPYFDLEIDPHLFQLDKGVLDWESRMRSDITEYLQQAKDLLINANYSEEAITIKVQNKNKGIARDIIDEARNSYDAILIGRKGTGIHQDIFMGSIANKIIDKINFMPVIMIGSLLPSKNILMAFDGSEGAFRALDYLSAILSNYEYNINLLFVIRGNPDRLANPPILYFASENSENKYKEVKHLFGEAKRRLMRNGFKEDRITTEIISGSLSRTVTIVTEARNGHYNTIVMGRKGLSKIREHLMGCVTQKIIRMISNRSVWVV
ncbi:MAG: universal stress protein [Desulfobacterales bacterium]|nr:universal stress protein [Desulfobacterales bacterium]